MEERRERNPDTGENIYIKTGAGFGDILTKVAAKLTGKTAKKLATKAAEKVIEKGAEKTGELIGEKIYDKFSSKKKGTTQPATTTETKGEEIMAILKQEDIPKADNIDTSKMFTMICFKKNNQNIIKRHERKF